MYKKQIEIMLYMLIRFFAKKEKKKRKGMKKQNHLKKIFKL